MTYQPSLFDTQEDSERLYEALFAKVVNRPYLNHDEVYHLTPGGRWFIWCLTDPSQNRVWDYTGFEELQEASSYLEAGFELEVLH